MLTLVPSTAFTEPLGSGLTYTDVSVTWTTRPLSVSSTLYGVVTKQRLMLTSQLLVAQLTVTVSTSMLIQTIYQVQ